VSVEQFFSRCSTALLYVETTGHVTPVSTNVYGSSAAAVVLARASAATTVAMMTIRFIQAPSFWIGYFLPSVHRT
jgi:hypothetical protein